MEESVRQLTNFIAVIVLISAVPAVADQVALKNGDRLTGTIVQSDGKTLVLHTEYAGDITVKWDSVKGIESSEPLRVELPNGKTAIGPDCSPNKNSALSCTFSTMASNTGVLHATSTSSW